MFIDVVRYCLPQITIEYKNILLFYFNHCRSVVATRCLLKICGCKNVFSIYHSGMSTAEKPDKRPRFHTPETLRGIAHHLREAADAIAGQATVLENVVPPLLGIVISNEWSIQTARTNADKYVEAIRDAIRSAREKRGDFGKPAEDSDTKADTSERESTTYDSESAVKTDTETRKKRASKPKQ